jgi:hypothetical protein
VNNLPFVILPWQFSIDGLAHVKPAGELKETETVFTAILSICSLPSPLCLQHLSSSKQLVIANIELRRLYNQNFSSPAIKPMGLSYFVGNIMGFCVSAERHRDR